MYGTTTLIIYMYFRMHSQRERTFTIALPSFLLNDVFLCVYYDILFLPACLEWCFSFSFDVVLKMQQKPQNSLWSFNEQHSILLFWEEPCTFSVDKVGPPLIDKKLITNS